MKTYSTLSFLAAGFSTLTLMSCNVQEQKPNVIFILADDLGWAQNRAYGSNYYHTPNIDRLAAEGIRFTDAYTAAAVSSPTRASIMTGKYPAKLHLTDFIPGNARDIYKLTQPDWQKFLPVEEYTLGNLFSDHGYITAMFGKWHLSREKFGPAALPNYPDKQGFYEYFVIDKPDRKTDPEHDPHCSDSIGNTSVDFIRKNKDKPFFLFMSFSAIHDPLTERSDSIAKWIKIPGTEMPENNPIIATMLSRLDRNVGQMLDILDELSLSRKTIVIFYSDNGGLAANNVVYYPDKTGLDIAKQSPLRAGKGWFYEGGIRVPLIIRWTGTIEKGRVSNEPVISCDFMPTFCELLGKKADSETDGISILSHLTKNKPLSERNLYWHYPHYHGTGMVPAGAIRSGNYKLIEWYEKSLLENEGYPFELYDLQNDLEEKLDLANTNKELVMQLAGQLKKWRAEVNAQMPVLNKSY